MREIMIRIKCGAVWPGPTMPNFLVPNLTRLTPWPPPGESGILGASYLSSNSQTSEPGTANARELLRFFRLGRVGTKIKRRVCVYEKDCSASIN